MSSPQPSAPRLLFRALTAHNLEQFYELVRDEHILRFLLDGQHKSRAWCAEVMENSSSEAARSGLGVWLLYEREREVPLGFAGFLGLDGPESPLQLLYALRNSHTGAATHARLRSR